MTVLNNVIKRNSRLKRTESDVGQLCELSKEKMKGPNKQD